VIGVYEPIVIMDAESVQQSSLLRDPQAISNSEARYHLACWTAQQPPPPLSPAL
jgi:hypothetical protein